ncbi:FecCD family ABC transporter permease [Billgrantia endophytica]|uniref:ABC transporter permease n=1 Tax=Billgrantia endophytica TaxID=2033802 RepID=A0A2N7UEG4_9GAMM|nr:iron ABC transporter permease [Halomonas endophytica]PMR78810.1 ABC transporter permease [Halomonas endophytica]
MTRPLARPVPPSVADTPRRGTLTLLPMLVLLLVATALVALGSGRYPLSAADVLRFFASAAGWPLLDPERYDLLYNLLVEIRLPRVLAAILVGAALAVSGAAFQGVFRNPLVSPNLLGVLSGAAFGAAAGMLFGGSWLLVQASAFGCGLIAVAVALMIARAFGQGSLVMLVLGGIISGALFAALLSVIKYVADPYNELPAIVIWLMGSLASVDIRDALWVSIPMGGAIVALCAAGRWLDALAMGDDEARSLGVPVTAVRYVVIGCATLLGALTVSLAGMIGWVGLIVPHVARLLCGPGHALLLPASALLGASFLLAADLLARALTDSEIPIGIVTELLGIPVFLLVLRRARKGWS